MEASESTGCSLNAYLICVPKGSRSLGIGTTIPMELLYKKKKQEAKREII
jgi:hypothetical protein